MLGHASFVRIDNVVYEMLGNEVDFVAANLIGFDLTPTSTRLSMKAPGMNINITYLSPLEVRPTLICI